MFYVKNYTFMKNQNFLLIQNEKKNTISKPFPFPSQRILRLNIVFSFCFLLCLSCADFCHFSDLLDQFICKCAFFHSPHPVTAKCRWHINSCLIAKSQIILHRNDARICHTSHRQTYEIPVYFFIRSVWIIQIFLCHLFIFFGKCLIPSLKLHSHSCS